MYDNYGCNNFKDITNYKEVVHGRWVDKEDYYTETGMTCSVCCERYWLESLKEEYNYCPNCGAYMRETYGDKNEIQA